MSINPQLLVAAIDLEEYFVDKDTGQPLSAGQIFFYEDLSRTTPKNVYELTGSPPNYTYVPLPNPIILSSVGTVSDNTGANVPIYYYPYDANQDLQLYYIVVTNADGVIQFVRQAWPNIQAMVTPTTSQGVVINALSNPAFVDVSFQPSTILSIAISGAGTTTYNIAPDWVLVVIATGASTVMVQRTAVAGSSQLPGQPPYTLTVTPGANITSIVLRQRLFNNPDIFSPPDSLIGGYVAGSIMAGPATALTLQYQPNGGAAQTIVTVNNISGNYVEYDNTVQLTAAANASTADTGYVDILINLSTTVASIFSNVQIVGLNSSSQISYNQVPANRQRDELFNYYNPLLQYKPIPSYLLGWDFPLNPGQALTRSANAIASGANTSNYFYDQTILFQSANSGVSVAPAGDGSLVITAQAATQLALVQYLNANTANEMLTTFLSCMMKAYTNNTGGLPVTISLYYTTGTLPSINASNASIVATLNTDGSVATTNAGSQPWVPIARSNLGNASFTLANGTTYTLNGFTGWLDTTGGAANATYFAIVVGTGSLAHTKTLTIQSISCVPGQIPTIPAPKSQALVNLDCYQFYQKSFTQAQVPVQAFGAFSGDTIVPYGTYANPPAAGSCFLTVHLPVPMVTPPTLVTYNPVNANANLYNYSRAHDVTFTGTNNVTTKGFVVYGVIGGGDVVADALGVHWSADSRLGL